MNQPTRLRVLRSRREIGLMRQAGLMVWQSHQAAFRAIRPGVTTAELNEIYRATFQEAGAEPLFLNYGSPPFPAETCISVNDEVVHGIPGSRALRDGDIVSLDTGCRIRGWCGDAAVTVPVGEMQEADRRLLQVTRETLELAIRRMSTARRWSEVATEMQQHVESAGFSVVRSLVGHGIGRELHEPPQVPNYFDPTFAAHDDFELKVGLVLAIEPMVNAGTHELKTDTDRWTIRTADGARSAHFEHTVALTADGPIRLTGPPDDEELARLPEWLHDREAWLDW